MTGSSTNWAPAAVNPNVWPVAVQRLPRDGLYSDAPRRLRSPRQLVDSSSAFVHAWPRGARRRCTAEAPALLHVPDVGGTRRDPRRMVLHSASGESRGLDPQARGCRRRAGSRPVAPGAHAQMPRHWVVRPWRRAARRAHAPQRRAQRLATGGRRGRTSWKLLARVRLFTRQPIRRGGSGRRRGHSSFVTTGRQRLAAACSSASTSSEQPSPKAQPLVSVHTGLRLRSVRHRQRDPTVAAALGVRVHVGCGGRPTGSTPRLKRAAGRGRPPAAGPAREPPGQCRRCGAADMTVLVYCICRPRSGPVLGPHCRATASGARSSSMRKRRRPARAWPATEFDRVTTRDGLPGAGMDHASPPGAKRAPAHGDAGARRPLDTRPASGAGSADGAVPGLAWLPGARARVSRQHGATARRWYRAGWRRVGPARCRTTWPT